jgi:hypothetical protein
MSDKNNPKKDVQSDDHHDEGGLGCSEMAYYNALMKGGKVTRNRIKKEEEPPADSKKADKLFASKKLVPTKKPQLQT